MTGNKTVLLHFECSDLPPQVQLGYLKLMFNSTSRCHCVVLNATVSGTLQKIVEAKNGVQNVAKNTTHLLAVSQM